MKDEDRLRCLDQLRSDLQQLKQGKIPGSQLARNEIKPEDDDFKNMK